MLDGRRRGAADIAFSYFAGQLSDAAFSDAGAMGRQAFAAEHGRA